MCIFLPVFIIRLLIWKLSLQQKKSLIQHLPLQSFMTTIPKMWSCACVVNNDKLSLLSDVSVTAPDNTHLLLGLILSKHNSVEVYLNQLLQVLIKVNLGPIYLGFWVYETTLPELHWASRLFQQLSNNFFPHKHFACLPWQFEACQVSDNSRMLGYKQTIYIKLNMQCMISL